MFTSNCFGMLIDVEQLQFFSQLMHNLLIRKYEFKRDGEIRFKVNDKILRLSKREFALITNLRFGVRDRDEANDTHFVEGTFKIVHKLFYLLCGKGWKRLIRNK